MARTKGAKNKTKVKLLTEEDNSVYIEIESSKPKKTKNKDEVFDYRLWAEFHPFDYE